MDAVSDFEKKLSDLFAGLNAAAEQFGKRADEVLQRTSQTLEGAATKLPQVEQLTRENEKMKQEILDLQKLLIRLFMWGQKADMRDLEVWIDLRATVESWARKQQEQQNNGTG